MKTTINPDFYEHQAWQKKMFVCGIDEVGRGCLAGPVVVAAAILPQNCDYLLTDSKKMSPAAREKAFTWLTKHSFYSVAMADATYIQQHNIYQATLFCMRKACLQLASRFPQLFAQLAFITVDAMPLKLPTDMIDASAIKSFIKGEEYSRSIAAASIIAKVTRDRLMQRLSPLFPIYTFGSDKAYASPKHCQTLRSSSATFIHRPQFITTVRTPRTKPAARKRAHEQQALF